MSTETAPAELSIVLTNLLKGVIYQESNDKLWSTLMNLRSAVSDFTGTIGLRLVIDEAEGYAYLRSTEPQDDVEPLPRLVPRRALSFPVSLLLALLRKKLAEFDATSTDSRFVLNREQIVETMRVFLPNNGNDARIIEQVDSHINKVIDLGFLRRMPNQTNAFEVRRIIKAYVDGQWLSELDEHLQEYQNVASDGDKS